MTSLRLFVGIALLALVAPEAHTQRIPIGGRDTLRTKPRDHRRYLYERPTLSPWVGVDFGLAYPMARCSTCDLSYGGWAPMGSLGAGVTIKSRLTLAFERSRMNVAYSRQDGSADLSMVTAQMGTRRGRLAKVGFGKGRYTEGPGQLVDDKPALMVGGETCTLSRVDGCLFADYTQTGWSSPRGYNAVLVHYRMHAVRAGLAFRLHALRGHRTTLAPRE